MIVVTKGMVGFAALIASGFTVARFIPASPAATDQNFFQTDTKADDFNELPQRARAALQTLIDKQQANERQRSGAAADRDQPVNANMITNIESLPKPTPSTSFLALEIDQRCQSCGDVAFYLTSFSGSPSPQPERPMGPDQIPLAGAPSSMRLVR